MNNKLTKTIILLSLSLIAIVTVSCSEDTSKTTLLNGSNSESSQNTSSAMDEQIKSTDDKIPTIIKADSVITETTSKIYETSDTDQTSVTEDKTNNILIVYFSHAGNEYEVDTVTSASLQRQDEDGYIGNTEVVALELQEITGGDLAFIETDTKYSSDDNIVHDEGLNEYKEKARPVITNRIDNIDQYDTIFIGYPLWWYDMPMAIYSFIESYDFSDKTLYPFVTHNGSGLGKSVLNLQTILSDASVMEGQSFNLDQVDDASELLLTWLDEQGYEYE